MSVEFDEIKNCYNVKLSKKEVANAFKSREELQIIMHKIVAETYSIEWADLLFPI